ncbi:stealth family protein [Micropruina sp.]|uniref:stealth family protein n=1 Tax=Micropruina sp. TaxID=2737536 RepID=UPI002617B5D4|nr:stealth family protein [Micropruina sp.]
MTLTDRLRRPLRTLRAHLQRRRRHADDWLWQRWPQAWRAPHEVVDRFDTWAYLDDLQGRLSELLDSAGVDHVVLDTGSLPDPRIAVRAPDADRALVAIADSFAGRPWWAARVRSGLIGPARPVRQQRAGGADGVLISRNLLSPAGIPLTDSELGVLIEFWSVTDAPTRRSGGSQLPPGTIIAPTSNGVLDYIDADQWAQSQHEGHRLPATPPHLLSMVEPIDLVYTWVDGNDPAWLTRKADALGLPSEARYSSDAAIDARFANRDELRYSLRSVEMFASWVRRIWIVTDGQTPEWLKPDDRLRIVDHREIFADPDALPVFNSHAIESQLHHIDGLAEHYLYLNDDMLFGAPVRPEHFFNGAGLIKMFISRVAVIDPAPRNEDDLAVSAAAKNNRAFLEREFGRTITHKLWHTPQPHIRSVMEQFEQEQPALFDTVMRSRFRSVADHALTSSLDGYYAMANGQAAPSRIRYGYLDLGSVDAWKTLELWLRRRNLQCLCINDSGAEDPAVQRANDAALRDFFDNYYPVPSRWE